MSIEQRLRSGLAANTEHLQPILEMELGTVLRRADRRRKVRRTVGALSVAAAVVVGAWVSDVTDVSRSEGPGPIDDKIKVVEPQWIVEIEGPLEAGQKIVPMWGEYEKLPRALVDVPAGFFTPGGWVIERETDTQGSVSFFTVDYVYPDPCEGVTYADIEPKSPQGLSDAIVAQPGHTTTPPRPVTFDGRPAVYLEVTVPGDSRLIACRGSKHALWRYEAADAVGTFDLDGPGVTSALWILQVEDRLVVVNVETRPGIDATERQELRAIAESAQFLEPLRP